MDKTVYEVAKETLENLYQAQVDALSEPQGEVENEETPTDVQEEE